MITFYPSDSRGHTEIGWLNSRHSFSFGEYHDPARMGFRSLRVINDDRVTPGAGFGTHGHRDMEIISIVLDGALEHKDSMGHGEILRPGEVQVMSAGSGVRHSEFNPSPSAPAHFLQVWIQPEKTRITPAYGQREFPVARRRGALLRVAGRDGVDKDGALHINQDADLYLAALAKGEQVSHAITPGRAVWVHVARGSALVAGKTLQAGDAVSLEKESSVTLAGLDAEPADILLFDLA